MFLFGCINRVLNQLDHGLPTAHQLSATTMENLYDSSTNFTFIDLKFFRHFFFLLLK
jgi:hypothetical protein